MLISRLFIKTKRMGEKACLGKRRGKGARRGEGEEKGGRRERGDLGWTTVRRGRWRRPEV